MNRIPPSQKKKVCLAKLMTTELRDGQILILSLKKVVLSRKFLLATTGTVSLAQVWILEGIPGFGTPKKSLTAKQSYQILKFL
jgi:hypothetical protein